MHSEKTARPTLPIFRTGTASPCAIVQHCLLDPTLSYFDRTPTCDGQKDIRMDRWTWPQCTVYQVSKALHSKNHWTCHREW